jgi:hypothetical protein
MRDYWSPLLSRSILPEGLTSALEALEARSDLYSWPRKCRDPIACLPQTRLEGSEIQPPLDLRTGREVAPPAFSDTGRAQPDHPYSLKRNFLFH